MSGFRIPTVLTIGQVKVVNLLLMCRRLFESTYEKVLPDLQLRYRPELLQRTRPGRGHSRRSTWPRHASRVRCPEDDEKTFLDPNRFSFQCGLYFIDHCILPFYEDPLTVICINIRGTLVNALLAYYRIPFSLLFQNVLSMTGVIIYFVYYFNKGLMH